MAVKKEIESDAMGRRRCASPAVVLSSIVASAIVLLWLASSTFSRTGSHTIDTPSFVRSPSTFSNMFTAPSGRRYYVHPESKGFVSLQRSKGEDVRPVLLLAPEDGDFSKQQTLETILAFNTTDDVFCDDFLSSTLVVDARKFAAPVSQTLLKDLHGTKPLDHARPWPLTEVLELSQHARQTGLRSGPYFLHNGALHEAWLLYPDYLEAFQTTIIPDVGKPYKFQVLDTIWSDGQWKSIAVPSRLYARPSVSKPLAGSRIAVKDLFKLAGIKTTLNVRSFLETYGPEEETAAYVKKLIDLGATIIGKTRMTAFAAGEKGPENWIDFQCPFNPRADGYQAPGGSTTGGAAALGGYDYIDFSIGSDTYGSIREPAALNGVFGMRVTTGQAASMEGVYPECKLFDTMGLLARNLSQFRTFAKSSLSADLHDTTVFPKTLLYPTDWFPFPDTVQQQETDKFVTALEETLGVRKTDLSLTELWLKSPPKEAKGKGLQEYLNTTGYNPFYYDCYHEYDYFRADHERKFGTPAYVGPHMRYIWNLGANITPEQREVSVSELEVFRTWFSEKVMQTDKKTASNAIIVLPVGTATPVYRDVIGPPFAPRLGVEKMNFASLLSLPQLVVPISQAPYHSRVTDRTEYLPIAGSIAGAPGSDLMLINLVQAVFDKGGYHVSVATGRFTFATEPHMKGRPD